MGSLKNWRSVLVGVILGLLGSGGIWLVSSPARGNPIQLDPAPTPAPIQVFVTGAIDQPGIYKLPAKSRIHDAIQAAGGFTDQANDQAINLAAPLEDGLQIRVPFLEIAQESGSPQGRGTFTEGASNPATLPLVNINKATREELEKLPGIGSVIAEAIIAYRSTQGEFTRIEEIQKVAGIGPAVFEDIKDQIAVTDLP
jgi:competence protein ComEA